MTFDITWHMTLLLISISLELFSLQNVPQINACGGTDFLFFHSLLGKVAGFSAVAARSPTRRVQGWDWTVARCTRSLRLLQRSPLRPASPCSRPALPASRSAFALVTTELSGHHGVCVRVALILLHGPSVQGW